MRTALLLCAACLLLAASPAKNPDCPPKNPRSHCVVLELKKPTKAEAEKIVKLLKADGVDASIQDSNDLSAMFSDAQLRKVLGAKVVYNSNSTGTNGPALCEAQIESIKAPARYSGLDSARIDTACQ